MMQPTPSQRAASADFKRQQLWGCLAIFGSAFFFYLATTTIRWSQAHTAIDPAFFVIVRFFLGFSVVGTSLLLHRQAVRPRKFRYLLGRTIAHCLARPHGVFFPDGLLAFRCRRAVPVDLRVSVCHGARGRDYILDAHSAGSGSRALPGRGKPAVGGGLDRGFADIQRQRAAWRSEKAAARQETQILWACRSRPSKKFKKKGFFSQAEPPAADKKKQERKQPHSGLSSFSPFV
jgi:hypothetical protein